MLKNYWVFLLLGVMALVGCSSKRPVLYPNHHLQTVGMAQANRDIEDCYNKAQLYLKSTSNGNIAGDAVKGGAVGAAAGGAAGAVWGDAGRGAGAGAAAGAAAGVTRGLLKVRDPSPLFMSFVNRCLREKGYDPIGWE